MIDLPKIIESIEQAISDLPQAHLIPEARRAAWSKAVVENELNRIDLANPEDDLLSRALWHVQRQFGIGGSEIGVMVGHLRGQGDPFTCARDIVAGKLLMTTPDSSEGPLLRGHFTEPLIQRLFLRSYDATRDVEAMSAFQCITPDENHPWQNGNPDDIVLIGKKRYLVDYKCPSPDYCETMTRSGMSLGYASQLHDYTMIAKRGGIDIDGMLLAPINTNIMRVYAIECPWDADLADEITEAGDFFWGEHVLAGKLPDYLPRPEGDVFLPDEEITSRVAEAAKYKAISDEAAAAFSAISDEIKQYALDGGMLGPGRMSIGIASLTSKEAVNYDDTRLLDLAAARGKNLEDYELPKTPKYDLDKLYADIVSEPDDKVSPDDLKSVTTSYGLRFPTITHKHLGARVYKEMREAGAQVVHDGTSRIAPLSDVMSRIEKEMASAKEIEEKEKSESKAKKAKSKGPSSAQPKAGEPAASKEPAGAESISPTKVKKEAEPAATKDVASPPVVHVEQEVNATPDDSPVDFSDDEIIGPPDFLTEAFGPDDTADDGSNSYSQPEDQPSQKKHPVSPPPAEPSSFSPSIV